jgi:tRNA threonylcarbamoyladenosine biosynthesis protein TsaB
MSGKPSTILAIETSTSACSVALRQGSVLRAEISVQGRGQAEALIPAVAAALQDSGLDWPEISAIAVTVGPGSFTGLRIGLAAARGLALARQIPVIGVGTADLLAHSVAEERIGDRLLLVAIDSKREDLFVQPFDRLRRPTEAIRAATPEQALAWQSGALLVVGDAAGQFSGLRADLEIEIIHPSAAILAALAVLRQSEGRALPAQPLYLRPPDVTIKS